MSIDDLAEKMDKRFDTLDTKVDGISTVVAIHTTELAAHDKANLQNRDEHLRLDARLDKLEKWMWFTLGAGGAAGAGLAKLFM